MTIKISRIEKALRLIATEGISAKEAAERVGISGAAVSKGKLRPSKSTQNIRKLCEMENEIESLRSELAALKAENESLKRDAERWRKIEQQWSSAEIRNNLDGSFKSMTITFEAPQLSDELTMEKLRRDFDAAMAKGEQGC